MSGREPDMRLYDDNRKVFPITRPRASYLLEYLPTIERFARGEDISEEEATVIKWKGCEILIVPNGAFIPKRIVPQFFKNLDRIRTYAATWSESAEDGYLKFRRNNPAKYQKRKPRKVPQESD